MCKQNFIVQNMRKSMYRLAHNI